MTKQSDLGIAHALTQMHDEEKIKVGDKGRFVEKQDVHIDNMEQARRELSHARLPTVTRYASSIGKSSTSYAGARWSNYCCSSH